MSWLYISSEEQKWLTTFFIFLLHYIKRNFYLLPKLLWKHCTDLEEIYLQYAFCLFYLSFISYGLDVVFICRRLRSGKLKCPVTGKRKNLEPEGLKSSLPIMKHYYNHTPCYCFAVYMWLDASFFKHVHFSKSYLVTYTLSHRCIQVGSYIFFRMFFY